MKTNFKFYLNYDIYCSARNTIKTNTNSSCKKINNNIKIKNGN